MKKIFALSLIVLTTNFISCKKETCPVSCTNGVTYYAAVGFTQAELNGAGVIFTFNSGKEIDTELLTKWLPPVTDTNSDTLLAGAFEGGPEVSTVELFVPSANSTYKIASLKYSGPLTEQLTCHEGGKIAGDPVGPGCSSFLYLQSYSVNGVTINTAHPADSTGATLGYIYFHK